MATQREMYPGNELYAWRENAANRTRAIDVDKWAQNQADLLHLPGAQGEKKLSILDNVISPSSAFVRVDTEGGAPADDLAAITPGDLHAGMLLHLVAADSERVVTLRNSADATGIQTVDGKDVALDTQYGIVLRLVSTEALTYWEEIPGPLRAKKQPVASKDNLGVMQVGQRLTVTSGGVVDAPLASESEQGMGRSATTAEVESGVTGENGPAWVTPEKFNVSLQAALHPVAVKALGIFNTRVVITTSNAAWTPPVDSWARITVIGGGGAGGGSGTSAGGLQGGSSSFGELVARGGSGGGSAENAGAGGGGAGKVVIGYAYLNKKQPIKIVVGAGGNIGTGVPAGPEAGVNAGGFGVGLGAAGAGNGSARSSSSNGRPAGGPGGLNGTGYGGGGGGYGGNYAAQKNPGGVAGDGGACGLPHGTGAGGNGAVIIEYFDPDKEAA